MVEQTRVQTDREQLARIKRARKQKVPVDHQAVPLQDQRVNVNSLAVTSQLMWTISQGKKQENNKLRNQHP